MYDVNRFLTHLERPSLLVRAARFGIDDYRRDRDLPRALKVPAAPRPGDALMQLLGVEDEINEHRLLREAEYSAARHIEVLTAIMCEARLIQDLTRARDAAT